MREIYPVTQNNATHRAAVRLAYLVSHPIQYQAPLLRRLEKERDIELTVLFGSDFSVRGYKDQGFGMEVAWDTPLLDGYRSEFLPPLRDTGGVSPFAPISRGLYRRLRNTDGTPAFDAIWVHGYASVNSLQAILYANALGIPVLLRAESWLADRERSGWKLGLKSLFFHGLRHAVASVLPIGTFNSRYWTHYLSNSVPQFLMPYAVDNGYFAQAAMTAKPARDQLRDELSLDAARPVILFASKLQGRKHADHLLHAYRDLVSDTSIENRPYLVIVGDGEQRGALESLASELGIDDVRFAGFRNQSELPRFFDLADVFVLPSRHEPWGLIVNESMACGCAIIVSSDVGSHIDLVTDGIEGFVYPVGNIAALTDALRRVLASPTVANAMGERARQRISTWSFEEDVRGLRAALSAATGKLKL
jgi:glycosyltransferase involved in cell wall biosynthesis